MSLFVDTSIWYAAADSSDAGNSRAKAVLAESEPLVTTDGVAAVEAVSAADLEAAWGIGVTYRDQDFSIVDRTSFAVMRRLGIERAASLDNHFAIFRFGPNRRRAFTIIR